MIAFSNKRTEIFRDLGLAFSGLILVLAVALVARYIHSQIPGPALHDAISEILIAVILGVCIRNLFGLSAHFAYGIKFALNHLLQLGIVLLGLRLSMQDVAGIGLSALFLVLICITIALALATLAGHVFHLSPQLAILIGVGTAICGNTAIVATAPVIGAGDDEVSFAVATITLFGLIAVIFYPILGRSFAMSDHLFGMWAGTAVNDTSQVVAVGAAYSAAALNIATVVKLTRNTLMAPLIVLAGWFIQRNRIAADRTKPSLSLGKLFPYFLLGFLALSMVRTIGIAAGLLPQNINNPGDLESAASMLRFFDEVAKFSILLALASVGLGTDVQSIRRIGLKPFAAGLCVATILAVTSLALIIGFGLG
jgi:uncharacterized integral membrane protein (TIGR00698 family)